MLLYLRCFDLLNNPVKDFKELLEGSFLFETLIEKYWDEGLLLRLESELQESGLGDPITLFL